MAAQHKAWVCCHSHARIVVSNPAGGIDICLFWLFCVGRCECFGLVTCPEEYNECDGETPKWDAISQDRVEVLEGKKVFSKINDVDESDRRKRRMDSVSVPLVVIMRDPKPLQSWEYPGMLSSLFHRSETFCLQASLFQNRFQKGQITCLQFSVSNKRREIKVFNENLYDMQVLKCR